jgi:hypothetical protein
MSHRLEIDWSLLTISQYLTPLSRRRRTIGRAIDSAFWATLFLLIAAITWLA